MAATRAPWVDVHAHPGRCFLAGLDAGDPLAGLLGGPDVLTSYADFAALPRLLAARGLGDADTDEILGGNALGLLRTVTGQAG